MLYRFLLGCSRVLGTWIVAAAASVIAAGYFVLLPRRLGCSVRLYRALRPERGFFYALSCAWRQYQDFAHVYAERLEIDRAADLVLERQGEELLREARDRGRGAVLLMSHFGRWELAARMLPQTVPLTILMETRGAAGRAEAAPGDLRKDGVDVVAIESQQGDAVDVLEGVKALRAGGFVSIAADRALPGARQMRVPFLGHEVALNMAPFVLALVTGAPLFVVFACRLGRRRYRFVCKPASALGEVRREDRDEVLRAAAVHYLEELRQMMLAYPEQWHGFGPFFL